MYHGTGKHAEAVRVLNEKAVLATVGIAGLGTSLYYAYDAVNDFNDGSKNATEAAVQLGISAAGAAASGALIGAQFGGTTGAVIGGLAGLIGTAITAWKNYDTELDKIIKKYGDLNTEIEEMTTQWEYSKETIFDNVQSDEVEITQLTNLKNMLKDCVDENGNLKAGYEDRAKYILGELNEALGTEFQLSDILAGKYDTIIEKIKETIKQKKIEMQTNYFSSMAEEAQKTLDGAIQQRDTAEQKLKEILAGLDDSTAIYSDRLVNLFVQWTQLSDAEREAAGNFESWVKTNYDTDPINEWLDGLLTKYPDLRQELSDTDQAYRDASKVVEESSQAIIDNNRAIVYAAEGDTEALGLMFFQTTAGIKTNLEDGQNAFAETYDALNDSLNNMTERLEGATEDEKAAINVQIENYKDYKEELIKTLKSASDGLTEFGPDVVAGWKAIADNSEEEYIEGLKGLEPETQKAIQLATGAIVDSAEVAKPDVEESIDAITGIINKLGDEIALNPEMKLDPKVQLNLKNLRQQIEKIKKVVEPLSETGTISQSFIKKLNLASTTLTLLGYKNGGLPDIGELFVAREAGPELVGKIGNSNAVMNNQQIVEAVSSGVAQAVASVMGGMGGSSYQLYIDGTQITDVIQRRMARNANITGMAMGV